MSELMNNISNNYVYTPALFAGSNVSRFSKAPDIIAKYSINDTLKEKDEFRKSVQLEYRQSIKAKKRNGAMGKILAFAAAFGTFLLLEAKKII